MTLLSVLGSIDVTVGLKSHWPWWLAAWLTLVAGAALCYRGSQKFNMQDDETQRTGGEAGNVHTIFGLTLMLLGTGGFIALVVISL